MKAVTKLVLKIIRFLSLENLFIKLPIGGGILKKFVPHPSFYPVTDRISVSRGGAKFNLNRHDWMQWHIYADIQDDSTKHACEALRLKRKHGQFVILDIGSNVGAFSFKLASQLKRNNEDFEIHAFDPSPYIASIFMENQGLNNQFKGHIFFHQYALSNYEGEAHFNFSSENSGGGSLQKEGIPR